ncbi:multidomain presynaptic cytomatrix related protein [Ophiostoma piceae UAMH 11346]|uniref:Autophagy-related protein 29 n=1 Tax=Ophiostoma piceae (strain UAMH 11346) TaxID=1262450 RepID=S3BTE4_OPHP1|nr:multidomain presynaptic cytomatrix related protein [Ophiostoma piceae UAMH 11346]
MDVDPKHDQALDLPLSFPGDSDSPRSSSPSLTTSKLQQHQREHAQRDAQRSSSRRNHAAEAQSSGRQSPKAPPPPAYTVYIRVPALRNGFVDPPDSNWSQEKDDALWRILSRAPKNNIDSKFETTVSFILIQSTVLTERHVSQVRAQTRKVAALGARDSPTQSPARFGEQSPSLGIASSRLAASPGGIGPALASEAMGRTLSGGSHVLAGRGSAETMRRTASAGSRTGTRPRSAAGTPASGSRRLSMEDGQARPAVSARPTLETLTSSIRVDSVSPSNAGAEQTRRLQSPLPIHATRRPGERIRGPMTAQKADSDEGDQGGRGEYEDGDPESLAASSTSSSNPSSDESEPVMSRIFRRPPGYPQQQQQQAHPQRQLRQQRHPRQVQDQYHGSTLLEGAAEAAYGGVGLGISSGGSDDGDESETQAAFLHLTSATQAVAGGSSSSNPRHQTNLHPNQRQPHRRPAALQEGQSSSPSSSASVSPTTKVFKGPTLAASAGSKAGAGSSSAASAAAAARLQQSRLPGVRSPPHLNSSSRSAARAGAAMISREGSDTGTTPSIGSSFSDLDDVSFTQSVLDEALGSKVEDTMVQHSSTDTLSSSANQRAG